MPPHSFYSRDFSKTVLSWSFETLKSPLEIAMQQPPLPNSEPIVEHYYNNFIPLILEETRAIIANGLTQVNEYMVQASRKGKKTSHLSEAKPFKLVLKKQANYPYNEGNPLSMTFTGTIPDKIEHGKSMNVLLLRTKNISLEKQFIALASENADSSELFVKIVIPSSDYCAYQECFSQDREWQAHYLGSVISEQRMYDACLTATNNPCIQQIARGRIPTPNVTRIPSVSININHLNLSQRESIFAFLNAPKGTTVLLQGPPGTGKTTTLVSLLKQVASQNKRTLVCAHSNKGVQVLALRSVDEMLNVPMIVIGVASKLPEKLKPIFLNGWHDLIKSHLLTYYDKVELLTEGKFNGSSHQVTQILAKILGNYDFVQQALNKFSLLDYPQSPLASKQKLFLLSNDPFTVSDFQNFQTHIDSLKQQPQNLERWETLLVVLNRLIAKWERIRKDKLESHLLNHASIVFSTLISAGRKSMLNMARINYLLVDEAAQSTEAATLIPMRLEPDNVLLVGDTKQLPATVISRTLDDSNRHYPSKNYKWSMMWRLIEELKQPNIMLTIQHRMHPQICQWPSTQYYEDRLITSPSILPMPPLSNTSLTSRPFAIYHVTGHTENRDGSQSMCNPQEAQYVIRIIEHIRQQNASQSIGVITPYAAQKRLICEKLSQKKLLQALVDVNTVDGFQGDERDIIIISFTRTHVSEFLKEFRRLNVAITRPKACLIILGAPTLLSNDIGEMMNNARRRNVLYSQKALDNILRTGVVQERNPSRTPLSQEDLAWDGNPHHQFDYAKTFEDSDPRKAFLWFRRAAENNHPEAQYRVSQIYLSGILVKKDNQLGIAWLDKSARQDFPLAQYALGKHYIVGEIIKKNVNAGILYCKKAADSEVREARLLLATYYDKGIEVPQDKTQAFHYYSLLANNNEEHLAHYHCGIMLEEGIGVVQNLTLARQHYEACQEKYLSVKLRLACLLVEKESTASEIREAASPKLEEKAARERIPAAFFSQRTQSALTDDQKTALTLLGFYDAHYGKKLPDSYSIEQDLERLSIARHPENNSTFMMRNITTHSPQINYLLGKILHEGKGVVRDIPRALQFYQSASTIFPDAHYRIGYIYESGLNGVKDWPKAKRYYQIAADKGHELAAKRLTWAYSMLTGSRVPDDAALRKTEANNCVIM